MTDEMNGNGRWNLPEKLLEEGLSARIHVFFFLSFFSQLPNLFMGFQVCYKLTQDGLSI